ncbi:FecR family protein [Aquisalimonas asiatica]|uniref:FecR family protein n=1 Tax=Aquisalimonas asiatica TaxID=406100 RepID=A0A1H8SXB3_9GAMM|nr:FecR family protein [Aquisalimonas asiatica]SEO83629.1 FecR family protein [Aquisalimonas asiatica]
MSTPTAGRNPSGAAIPDHLLEEAAEWRVQLDDPALPTETREAFRHWLQHHPAHEQAWQAINATWDALAGVGGPGAGQALEHTFEEEQRDIRRWLGRSAGVLLLLLALAPLIWLVSGIPSPGHLLADHHTTVGETRTVELSDGSRLILNTATAVDIRFDEQRRQILLRRGEIHLTAAQDDQRPLEVVTDEGRARALGTRFGVRRMDGGGATRVTVQHSRVRVCAVDGSHCRELHRGQQSETDGHRVTAPVSVDPDASAAWTTGRLVLDDAPVTEVLAELGRHHRGLFRVDHAALRDVRMSGVIPLHDTDQALQALESTLPLRVQRFTPWVIHVSHAR